MPTGDFDTSKTASDKRPVNLGLSGFIDSDLTNKLLQADTHKDAGVTDIAKNAAQAMLHSAIQSPMEAVVQIGAAATGQKFEAPTLISAPKPAEFGSSEWCAQTVGSGIGMVAPFLASEAI